MAVKTTVLSVDPESPDTAVIQRAAARLLAGDLIAFPTETVYGLGANALNAANVKRIFKAKGRPPENPVIVHVADTYAACEVVSEWSSSAAALAAAFWPGPLTLVLPKSDRIPALVTAGGRTVAVRAPDHRVAQALLRAAGVPIAAPSANRSGELSPTKAEHVLKSLEGRIEAVLDGGPCPGGVESTVLDLTSSPPRILRPGFVTAGMLEPIIGPVAYTNAAHSEAPLRSPGLLSRHYAPRATLRMVRSADEEAHQASNPGRVGLLPFEQPDAEPPSGDKVNRIAMPRNPSEYAARLYAALHELDNWGANVIYVSRPPATEEWRAVTDRLTRASMRHRNQ